MTTEEMGRRGEDAAAAYLRHNGYELYSRNWHSGPYELDIVAVKRGVLHFVEVKTRRQGSLTTPESALTQAKIRSLYRAAKHYLAITAWDGEVQFDLAAVSMDASGRTDIDFIENAMECHW